jgi:hypothetical protein
VGLLVRSSCALSSTLPCVTPRLRLVGGCACSDVDRQFFGAENPGLSRRELLEQYMVYTDRVEAADGYVSKSALVKPLLRLFSGCRFARMARRELADGVRESKVRQPGHDCIVHRGVVAVLLALFVVACRCCSRQSRDSCWRSSCLWCWPLCCRRANHSER